MKSELKEIVTSIAYLAFLMMAVGDIASGFQKKSQKLPAKEIKERKNLEKCITMIKKNPKTINDHLNRKYGDQGTEIRNEFT